jgi:chromosomal replication initiator protein
MVDAIVDIPLPGRLFAGQRGDEKASSAAAAPCNFLAGPENRLVEVVVRNVLEEKPNGYNPIILYGPSGTGKSHLALGMAAAWKARNRHRAEYVSAVDFARELADAIETQAVEEFRAKYRRAGLLVFEDIGRLVNRKSEKLSAQDEFVYTLDTLINRDSWVIVTSLSAPGEMTGILPALQSRLTAGLMVPLAPPESNTRLAIIRRLAEMRRIDLPDPLARTLADGLHGTVPELMGALIQLQVPQRGSNRRIDAHAVRALLAERENRLRPNLHAIALTSAKHFGLKLSELRSPSRQQAVVAARNAATYLARNMLQCSFEEIGQYFGGRDHTTVMHGWRKMEKLLKIDPATKHEIDELEQELLKTSGNN